MDNKNNSGDVIRISLMDLIRIILVCVLVLFLIGYGFILCSYKQDTETNRNIVVNTLKENESEDKFENVIDTSIDNTIIN